jgi:hypothetical protein
MYLVGNGDAEGGLAVRRRSRCDARRRSATTWPGMAEELLGGGGGDGGGEVVTIIVAGVACRANDFCGSCSASGLTSLSRDIASTRIHRVFHSMLTVLCHFHVLYVCSYLISGSIKTISFHFITSADSSTGHSSQQHT